MLRLLLVADIACAGIVAYLVATAPHRSEAGWFLDDEEPRTRPVRPVSPPLPWDSAVKNDLDTEGGESVRPSW